MLAELRIVDLGVIGDATVELAEGFTAVTGETGAGKTMIVTGLGLLAGAKAYPRLIRTGAGRAIVEGVLTISPDQLSSIEELGAEADGGEVLVSRQLGAARSRLTVGGIQVPLSQGQQVIGDWVTVHGQSEQVRLGGQERQREVLDRYAGADLVSAMERYSAGYQRRLRLQADLDDLTSSARSRLRELDLLGYELAEIARIDPQPGEDLALAVEARRLQSVDDLRAAVQGALLALAGDDSSGYDSPQVLGLLAAARKALEPALVAGPDLADLGERLGQAVAELGDVASMLAGQLDSLEADPARLEWLAGRRSELQSLTRKYGDTIDEVLAHQERAAARVSELSGGEERIAELESELQQVSTALVSEGKVVTRLRRAAAEKLQAEVGAELAALAMPAARLSFQIRPLAEPGPHGMDQIVLLFSANPGSAPGPLAKVASGGELSRVRLALEVVLASGYGAHTFVFDEVDAGVGGAVALEIGARLARLARHSQVVVVTHLAQVAAFADRHYVVTKSDDGAVTTSGVSRVEGERRVAVLATMMGGLDSSEAALDHARELLASAGS